MGRSGLCQSPPMTGYADLEHAGRPTFPVRWRGYERTEVNQWVAGLDGRTPHTSLPRPAFTLVLRRLRARGEAHGGLGVAVILRYTLGLLTLDQLARATVSLRAVTEQVP